MGWDFKQGATKADVIRELKQNYKAQAWRTVKNTFYFVAPNVPGTDAPCGVYVALLDNDKGFGWGCKLMHEDEYPLSFDCPVALLDVADAPATTNAQKWREKCRENRPAVITGIGDVITLREGCSPPKVVITEKIGRTWFAKAWVPPGHEPYFDRRTFRIRPCDLNGATVTPAASVAK